MIQIYAKMSKMSKFSKGTVYTYKKQQQQQKTGKSNDSLFSGNWDDLFSLTVKILSTMTPEPVLSQPIWLEFAV